MFTNIYDCGLEETQRQISYLSSTPVFRIAQLLQRGQCILRKGVVCSLQHLGSLKTEFGQIGSLTPMRTIGDKKFLVSEVVPLLRANPGVFDGGLLKNIEAIMEREATSEIDFNVTVFLWNGEAIIKDGNKRTIAFFENRRNLNHSEINYEVYLVEPIQHNT